MGYWLSKQELLARIPGWAADNLQAEEFADWAIASAEVYITTLLRSRKRYPPSPNSLELLKEATYYLALYHLYSRIEQEEKATDKREMAMRLLDALFEGEGENLTPGNSATYVKEGRSDWYGFH